MKLISYLYWQSGCRLLTHLQIYFPIYDLIFNLIDFFEDSYKNS